jgi:hypothetical protein
MSYFSGVKSFKIQLELNRNKYLHLYAFWHDIRVKIKLFTM